MHAYTGRPSTPRPLETSLGLRRAETSDQMPPRLAFGRRSTPGEQVSSLCWGLVLAWNLLGMQTHTHTYSIAWRYMCVCLYVCNWMRVVVRDGDHGGVYFWLQFPFNVCRHFKMLLPSRRIRRRMCRLGLLFSYCFPHSRPIPPPLLEEKKDKKFSDEYDRKGYGECGPEVFEITIGRIALPELVHVDGLSGRLHASACSAEHASHPPCQSAEASPAARRPSEHQNKQ